MLVFCLVDCENIVKETDVQNPGIIILNQVFSKIRMTSNLCVSVNTIYDSRTKQLSV